MLLQMTAEAAVNWWEGRDDNTTARSRVTAAPSKSGASQPVQGDTLPVLGFKYETTFKVSTNGEQKLYMMAKVKESENSGVLVGDLIYSCNETLFKPGIDLSVVINTSGNPLGVQTLRLLREISVVVVTVNADPEAMTSEYIETRRIQASEEAIHLNALLERDWVYGVSWKN